MVVINSVFVTVTSLQTNYTKKGEAFRFYYSGDTTKLLLKATAGNWNSAAVQHLNNLLPKG
jgi:hypothetical protein